MFSEFYDFSIGRHDVVGDVSFCQTSFHGVSGHGGMGDVVHMGDEDGGFRGGHGYGSDIFVVHDEAAEVFEFCGAGIDGDDFGMEFFDGFLHFGVPYGVTGDVEGLFVLCLKDDAHGVSAGNDGTVAGGCFVECHISKGCAFFGKDAEVGEAGFFKYFQVFFVLEEEWQVFRKVYAHEACFEVHIHMVGMDVGDDDGIYAGEDFFSGHGQGADGHGDFHFQSVGGEEGSSGNGIQAAHGILRGKPGIEEEGFPCIGDFVGGVSDLLNFHDGLLFEQLDFS